MTSFWRGCLKDLAITRALRCDLPMEGTRQTQQLRRPLQGEKAPPPLKLVARQMRIMPRKSYLHTASGSIKKYLFFILIQQQQCIYASVSSTLEAQSRTIAEISSRETAMFSIESYRKLCLNVIIPSSRCSSLKVVWNLYIAQCWWAAISTFFSGNPRRSARRRPATAGTQFKISLGALLNNLGTKMPHYVRCIRPNDSKQAKVFDMLLVQHQVTYQGYSSSI